MAEKKEAHHGKQPNQKMKPFIVMQYLQRNTDENHTCSSTDIIDYLNNECGISADRRSIYRDIAEINKAMYMIEQVSCTGAARDGADVFEEINIKEYSQQVFGMFGGEKKRVQIRFVNKLLDTAVERFGKGKDTFY